MITITKKLDMSPHGIPQVIHVSQYDSDFSIQFKLYASVGTLSIESGTTAEIRGTKGSGTGYSASATLNTSNGTVTVAGSEQMTAVAGRNTFEIVLKKSGKVLGSANFVLLVERAALDADTITDASVLRELNAIVEGAETATQAAEDAEDAADRAEASSQTLVIDPTLTLPGQPADAKATGDAIAQIVPGLSETAKTALLNCFAHVAWIDEHGQDYYDALHDALCPATGLVSISAVFTQGSAVINEGDDLNTLKQYLVVTGYYGDGVSQVITDYALSGQLTEGTSTITVTKEGKTATFTVTVTGEPVLTVYVGRGADLNNMDQTVSQANRCISEKIRFTNIAPITVQWEENTSYRFVLKNILLNGKGDSPDGYVWMPDYNTQLTGDNTLFGWINSNTENTFSDAGNNLSPVAYRESSGYARIIFAPKSSMSAPLPSAIPSGHITVNGKRYKIQTVQQ